MPQDVVVVGGGIAGLSAAVRAAELGLVATVLEQGKAEKYLCNSRYTGGTFHVAMNDIMVGEEALEKAISRATAGAARPDLVQAVAHDGERVVRWLQQQGMRFMKASGSAYHNWVLAPPGRSRPGLDWEGRAGDVLLRTLEANLGKRGGRVVRGARARSLSMEDGCCAGVVAEVDGKAEAFEARAVVIADGGFQADPELVAGNITPHPEKLHQRGAGTGMGDGLRMARAAGAATSDMKRFYGHVLSRDAFRIPTLWPYPYLDSIAVAGMVVDGSGRRFCDEGRGGVAIANRIAELADPLSAFLIFDAAIWEGPGRAGLIPSNPHLAKEGGTLHRAATIGELADLARLPAPKLETTLAAYNHAVTGNALGSLDMPRTTDKHAAMPVARAPLYAAPVCAGITYTMGGILTDADARVLRQDGKPITGLYAAGAATGGLEGGPLIGYVGGLAKSTVFGLRAAEHIASASTPAAAIAS